MINELKKLASEKYPMVFHKKNNQAVLWNGALDSALINEFGYDIDVPNEENMDYPTLLPLRGRIGSRTYAVVIFQEGGEYYVEF